MVEGLTSSATELGSVAGKSWIDPRLDSDFEDRLLERRPREHLVPVSVAAEQHPDATNPGDTGGEAIPVPIPNTEVKLYSAEDTARAAFRETRSSPGFLRSRGWHLASRCSRACPWLRRLPVDWRG